MLSEPAVRQPSKRVGRPPRVSRTRVSLDERLVRIFSGTNAPMLNIRWIRVGVNRRAPPCDRAFSSSMFGSISNPTAAHRKP
jgi:hypothetical protein